MVQVCEQTKLSKLGCTVTSREFQLWNCNISSTHW